MTFSVHYDSKTEIALCSITGKIDSKVIDPFIREVLNLLSKHDCKRFLIDLRSAKLGISTIAIYQIPEMLNAVGIPRLGKRAVIVSTDLEDYAFLETVSVTRGYKVKIFIDPDEAKDWLRS
jgi:hypothetical protein